MGNNAYAFGKTLGVLIWVFVLFAVVRLVMKFVRRKAREEREKAKSLVR